MNNKTVFIGQAVTYPGTAMFNSLVDVPKRKSNSRLLRKTQMGITIGFMLNKKIPVSIYPRLNFLLCVLINW